MRPHKSTRPKIILLPLGLLIAMHVPVAAEESEEAFFEKKIRPLLIKRCHECHSGPRTSGGLSLEHREGWRKGGESGPAIVPGQVEESLLIDAINYRMLEMPPPDKGGKLPQDEIRLLTEWVRRGAFDPRRASVRLGGMSHDQADSWWSFQPLKERDQPLTSNDLDALIEAGFKPGNPTASHLADRRSLLRRASYDLTGLPPTFDATRAFLSDNSDMAFSKVIDQWLDSPQYGVRWGRYWLDIVRYADTAGENTDRPLPHAWRYRNWVIDSFNRDLPYDQFVRMQIAGDLLDWQSEKEYRDGIIATGYLAIARRFGHDIDKDIHLMHEDVIDNLGKNFLGLTLGCARCHDHKYDPVSTADYYALYGIFSSTRFAFPGCEPKGQPRDLVPLLSPDRMAALQEERARRKSEVSFQREQVDKILARQIADFKVQKDQAKIIASATVAEGGEATITDPSTSGPVTLDVSAGDLLELTILRNGGHGADSTRVDLRIESIENPGQAWHTSDLVDRLLESNPTADGIWTFLNPAKGIALLPDRIQKIDGQEFLSAWRDGPTPSVFVNRSESPVAVWTTLPPRTFFMHPGPQGPVALTWTSPVTGRIKVSGTIADAHPAPGLDGIAFELRRISQAGPVLAQFSEASKKVQQMTADLGPEPSPPVAYAVVDGDIKDVRIHERGDPETPGNLVERRWLEVFGADRLNPESSSGRRELSDKIINHPLLARVMVNRIWQAHFGQGLVTTPNDFGSRGDSPTHPRILEALSAEFRRNGYRIKPLHRLIMQTKAYQRSSIASADATAADPENKQLGRFHRRRLTAEEIRDSLLFMSGQLDVSPGQAHPFPPESGWTFTQHSPFNAVYDTNRRSVYLMVQRQRRHPYLALFDGANPNASTAVREQTNVPTQALYFLNDPFFHAQAREVVRPLLELTDDSLRLTSLYQRLLQRDPALEEKSALRKLVRSYPGDPADAWAACARVILASNEFLYID